MEKQINFIEKWYRGKSRDQTWSGTPYGLYSALERNGVVVNDVPIGKAFISIICSKAHGALMKLFGKNDFSVYDILLIEKELRRKKIPNGIPSLFFTQYRFDDLENTYYYQDYSVQFLKKLRDSGAKVMDYTPLRSNVSENDLEKRLAISSECADKCRGIFTMSNYLAQDYIENAHIPQEKVHWVGGGYNIDISKIDYSEKTGKRFLFVGTTWETKNGPLIVEAFKKLREVWNDVELWIVGPSKKPWVIENVQGISFFGNIPHSKVVDFYNKCDYLVMPSKADAYGLVFTEALVCGLPCIGKNAFAMPEFIQNGINGYLLNNDDALELIEHMDNLIRNRDSLCAYIREKKDYYKECYSWDTVAKRIIEVMEKDGYFKEA